MEHTNRANRDKKNQYLTVNIGRSTLSFVMNDDEEEEVTERYTLKSGISIAANLREAFKTCEYLEDVPDRARVFIDSDVLMVPMILFHEEQAETLFFHAFPGRASEMVFFQVLTELHAVAISSINKDLKTVLDDHFQRLVLYVALSPVWEEKLHHSFTGNYRKLYGHFHEHRLDLFSFQQNRFRFFNSFEVKHPKDAVFFILYVWKQLRLEARNDELYLSGNIFQEKSATTIEEREELLRELRKFLLKVKSEEQ